MTTLIAWTSHDQRNFSAFHVASDSRITWGSSVKRWDAGRKIFSSSVTPDIWAYSGDVLFPALVLSQIIDAVDLQLLFPENLSASDRNEIIFNVIQVSLETCHEAPISKFSILHASRDGEKTLAEPVLWCISYDPKTHVLSNDKIEIRNSPEVFALHGSGAVSTDAELRKWKKSDIGCTSRSIYSAFCASIANGDDPLSGGAPQLASIYPSGPAKTIGTLSGRCLYLHGLPIVAIPTSKNINWFDELFQRVDPNTFGLLKGAARHAVPKFRGR
ncbi:hypothetical protein [Thalassospira marina]|uniref:hypothetical protein n=1 Tax=Thalassospira marina TaxID=2048283 RepID=UPI00105418E6|nr:hypothetical protein [Thalassospira marina]